MISNKFYINEKQSFLLHLLSNKNAKKIIKEFEFYNVRFVREEITSELKVYLEYP